MKTRPLSRPVVTESVCPACLRRIPAQRVRVGDEVFLEKTCPEHGPFRTVVWRGAPAESEWRLKQDQRRDPQPGSSPAVRFTPVQDGCPYDCGLCPDHQQEPCCVLLEVSGRCDLVCPVCFAGSTAQGADPDLATVESWYARLKELGRPVNIQLSGGEPCCRDDLPEIITLGRRYGFTFFQLNTNGLRLARQPEYLRALKEAGLSTVFLQFDGTEDAIYQKLRGRPLLAEKTRAIENCIAEKVGVILTATLAPGVNSANIGATIEFALSYAPQVRGVHFQPVSYFGRFRVNGDGVDLPEGDPQDAQRITLPEVMAAIASQTGGKVQLEGLQPPGAEHALCSFHGYFVIMPDGSLTPLVRQEPRGCCGKPGLDESGRSRSFVARQWIAPAELAELPPLQGAGLGGWDDFLRRVQTHTFCLSGMAFQDAWTIDLARLHECYLFELSPDGRLVPFCAYNLTDRQGRALYRRPVEAACN